MQDFFTGGSGTVSKTLAFCIYYLAHHPDYQVQITITTKMQSWCSLLGGVYFGRCIDFEDTHTKSFQDKARTEIQAAVSCGEENGLVSLEQRDLIPFTEACLLESQRMGSVLPISPPRSVLNKPFLFYF